MMTENKNISLVVFAAGMGTRFGGLKQIAEVGPQGECLLDYTLYDAKRAGFTKIIFIIQTVFEDEFKAKVVSPWESHFDIQLVYQSTQDLPEAYAHSFTERTSPWGTSHALWVARHTIQEPFAIINADDFYGEQALDQAAQFLLSEPVENKALIVAYELQQTLSDKGSVNRGVCSLGEQGQLISIDEHTGIAINQSTQSIQGLSSFKETSQELQPSTLVSMNLWGFHPQFMQYVDAQISSFWQALLYESETIQIKKECYLPSLVTQAIEEGEIICQVQPTQSPWMGMTYAEDLANIKATLRSMVVAGAYPQKLH